MNTVKEATVTVPTHPRGWRDRLARLLVRGALGLTILAAKLMRQRNPYVETVEPGAFKRTMRDPKRFKAKITDFPPYHPPRADAGSTKEPTDG